MEAVEATTVAEVEMELISTEPSEANLKEAAAFLDRCNFTTVGLVALAAVIRNDHGDDTAVDLVLDFARKFASHEATTI